MDLDLLVESDSDSDSSHSNQDNASVQRSAVTMATAGSDAGNLAYFSEDDEDTAESSNQEEESEIEDSDDGQDDDLLLQPDSVTGASLDSHRMMAAAAPGGGHGQRVVQAPHSLQWALRNRNNTRFSTTPHAVSNGESLLRLLIRFFMLKCSVHCSQFC